MKFIRHIGRHGDRKVAVVFREVPGEPHMCLVAYTETLNQHIHDPLMQCIESDIGQHSEHLAEALNRAYTRDGKQILVALHNEGQLKKVNTEQIVMTPQSNTKIKLSELNKILDEMQKGEDAVKRLAELDKSLGLQDPRDVARRMRGDALPEQMKANAPMPPTSNTGSALNDNQLANNLLQQAKKMEAEANGLLAESSRLVKQANDMLGIAPAPAVAAANTTDQQSMPVVKPAPKRRGRPAVKSKVAA